MPLEYIKNEEIFYSQLGNPNSPYTLLFIHGATSNNDSLKILAAHLTDYNCITIDLPCHGQSKGAIRKSVSEFADFMEDFIATMQEKKFITHHITLLGCSMGGFISLELAIRKLPYLKRLVILSSGADASVYSDIIPQLSESTPENFDPKYFLRKSFSLDNSTEYIESIFKVMEAQGLPSNDICYYDFSTVMNFNRYEELSSITIPTLAIIGDEDRIIPVLSTIHLKEQIPTCDLAIIPFSGHTVLLDEPVYIAKAVGTFLNLYN